MAGAVESGTVAAVATAREEWRQNMVEVGPPMDEAGSVATATCAAALRRFRAQSYQDDEAGACIWIWGKLGYSVAIHPDTSPAGYIRPGEGNRAAHRAAHRRRAAASGRPHPHPRDATNFLHIQGAPGFSQLQPNGN